MEIIIAIAVLLLIGHVLFHPLRALGCMIEAIVGVVLAVLALGALAAILMTHSHP